MSKFFHEGGSLPDYWSCGIEYDQSRFVRQNHCPSIPIILALDAYLIPRYLIDTRSLNRHDNFNLHYFGESKRIKTIKCACPALLAKSVGMTLQITFVMLAHSQEFGRFLVTVL